MEESGRNALGMCFLPITAELVTGAGQVQAPSPGPVYSTATPRTSARTPFFDFPWGRLVMIAIADKTELNLL